VSERASVVDPAAQRSAVESATQWCLGLAVALAEAAAQVGRLADRIAQDWPDEHGLERAERTALLHRQLGRDALAAAELGGTLAQRGADDPIADHGSVATAVVRGRAGRGARLGGTESARVEEERGMRIAQLPDQDGPPG
jgi:hypothetical protein